ncbi:MAG: dynein light chain type 1-domain-containing protein [Monoraphidium minutum]|nr:MAG: dynein light chain type 1-domain-containing protein [Monoraphidium minutum]
MTVEHPSRIPERNERPSTLREQRSRSPCVRTACARRAAEDCRELHELRAARHEAGALLLRRRASLRAFAGACAAGRGTWIRGTRAHLGLPGTACAARKQRRQHRRRAAPLQARRRRGPSRGASGSGSGASAAAMAADTQQQRPADMEAFLRQAKYPLIKYTDMTAEMREEAMDVCITAVEKYPQDVEKCTQMIKDQMDKKFGSPWHVIVGRAFAYEVTYELRNMLYLYVGGTTGVLLWKM